MLLERLTDGGNTLHFLEDADQDSIYQITIDGFVVGSEIEYKFRFNGIWDGREEFPGEGNNRKYKVLSANNALSHWYNDQLPPGGALQAGFTVDMQELYAGGVVTFSNTSLGEWEGVEWTFVGGEPSSSNKLNPSVTYSKAGAYEVSLRVFQDGVSDTLTVENYVEVKERDTLNIPWWNRTVFYEIFVRSFYDSDGDGRGDFKGLTEKLDYLNDGDPSTNDDLGIQGIWLMPINPSPSYHGYDVTNYKEINPDYGSMADFREFVEEAHRRGIKVIIDFVINHTSTEHPWFKDAQRGDSSPYRDFYRWSGSLPNYQGPWGQPVWHRSNGEYYYGLFWSGMPDVNYNHPPAKDSMFEAANFWLSEIGVDGLRLDAIKYIYEEGQSLEDLPATFNFFKDFRNSYKSVAEDAFAVGEAWTKTETVVKYVEGGGIDYCFEFDLASQLLNAVRTSDPRGLRQQIQKVYNLYPHLQYGTFLTNHDQNRLMDELGNNEEKVKVAAGIYLTLPGVPYVYYGEEIGMNGVKPDEDIRKPMQWTDGMNGGFTNGTPWRNLNGNYRTYNVSTASANDASLLNWYRSLIHLRNAEAALQMGTYVPISSNTSPVLAYLREYQGDKILVLINTWAERYQEIKLDFSKSNISAGRYSLKELLTNSSSDILELGEDQWSSGMSIEGYGVKIFKFDRTTPFIPSLGNSKLKVYPNPLGENILIEVFSFLTKIYILEVA